MNIFNRRKILKSTNALDLVPVRAVSHTEEEGKIVLLVPKFTGRLMHNLFPVTEKMFFRIKLDESGSRAWEAIDGERTVAQIAEVIHSAGVDAVKSDDHQSRLLIFISTLYEREYISFRQIMMSG